MKLSFVIPSINQFKMLFNDCIDSFNKHHPDHNHEFIVVDDASQNGLQPLIEEECKKRGIVFLKNEKNSGFPITCNRGIRAATGDVIVIVNNDIVFTQRVDQQIEQSFSLHPRVGIVGSLLFYPNGTIQHGGIVMAGFGSFTHRGWHKSLDKAPDVTRKEYLIGVTGALFAIKKETFDDIGLFNENYFLSCDDTELCIRSWSKDWRVLYNPDIRAIHAEGATRGRTDVQKQRDHRTWYVKEIETWGKFQQDLKRYDLARCLMNVSECNAELLGIRKKPPESEALNFVENKQPMIEQNIDPKNQNVKKILVRRTGALGDVIMATGVIKKLKQEYPNASIVVSTVCQDVFRNSPHVSAVIRDVSNLTVDKFIDLDMAYEMHPKMPIWEAYAQKAELPNNLDLRPEMFSNEYDLKTLKQKLSLPLIGKIAVLHMGVSWVNRTWPRHKWIEVCRKLSSIGYKVVTVGKGADFRSELFQGVYNLVDQLSIHEIRELCNKASVFVGVDSGMLHVAQTTSIPIVSIFTVADPRFRIFQRSSRTIALVPKLECRFCLHEKTPPVTFVDCKFGTNHCLNDISADDVVKSVTDIARDSVT